MSKKLGQENHNTVDDLGHILVSVFSVLIFQKEYNDKWLKFDSLEYHCYKAVGYVDYDEMRLDQQQFVYFFIKTFETLGFIKRINLDLKVWDKLEPGYSFDLQQTTLFPNKHAVNSDWHNFDNMPLVRLINDPKVYNLRGAADFDYVSDQFLESEFEKYVYFCKGKLDCLMYENFTEYCTDQQFWILTHADIERAVGFYLHSEYLIKQFLDYLILDTTYMTCNGGRAYLIDGVEYDKYFSNL